jgi:hypothetical protein
MKKASTWYLVALAILNVFLALGTSAASAMWTEAYRKLGIKLPQITLLSLSFHWWPYLFAGFIALLALASVSSRQPSSTFFHFIIPVLVVECFILFMAQAIFALPLVEVLTMQWYDHRPNTALEPTPTAPWVYGRFKLYNDYRVCGAARPSAWLSFGSLGGDDTMKTITWILAILPPVVMFSWLSASAFLPGLYTHFIFSAFLALYFCSTVLCLIWGGICILRKWSGYGFISFGLSLLYFCLPALFTPSLWHRLTPRWSQRRLSLEFMDGLSYTTIIEFAEPPAGRRGSALDR